MKNRLVPLEQELDLSTVLQSLVNYTRIESINGTRIIRCTRVSAGTDIVRWVLRIEEYGREVVETSLPSRKEEKFLQYSTEDILKKAALLGFVDWQGIGTQRPVNKHIKG